MIRRPLEMLNLLVLLTLLATAGVLAALGRLDPWWPSVRLYLLLLGLLGLVCFLLSRRHWRPRWLLLGISDFYPILLIPQVFNSLQPLITAVGLPNQDAALIAIDQAILGGRHATVWLERFVTPWLNDVMHLGYCTYYFFCPLVGLAMWTKSREFSRRFIFTASLAFYISYVGYFLVPARGPRFVQDHLYTVSTRDSAISRAIYDTLNFLEKTKDDVYPSGHVMVTVVCLMAAWRFNRRLFTVLLPIAVLLCTATVYCRYHYVIDVLSGLALALVTLPAGYALYDRWAAGEAGTRIDSGDVPLGSRTLTATGS